MTTTSVRFSILLAAFSLFSITAPMGAATFTIDMSGERTAISPLVYGLNDWQRDSATASINFTLERNGGNRMTSYNWENNASNAGSDYIHHSDNQIVNSVSWALQTTPGEGVMLSVDHARGLGHPSLVTLQLAGYVAADTNGTVTEAQVAPSSRWKAVRITKGATLSLTPDTTDGYVYMDEQVNFLVQKYGKADAGGVFAYSLDNEPAVWSSTHARLHPAQPKVSEIIDQGAAAAIMVKSLDPSAQIFGPALYGWSSFQTFQNAPDWTGTMGDQYSWFISYYLAQMKARSDAAGVRLLDVMDVHFYPEASGVNASGVDTRITGSDTSPGVVEARLQAARSLWDNTYTESSWITTWFTQGPIELLPRLQESIDTYYPGTGIGITEYDYGAHYHYSGGIAQADVLGAYGKYGVYAACYWGDVAGYMIPAFQLYRNYDGNESTFGDESINVTNPDAASYSAYASVDDETGDLHIILINKTAFAQTANVTLTNSERSYIGAGVYGFDETHGATIVEYPDVSNVSSGFSYTLPAHSALHFVLQESLDDALEIETVGDTTVKLRFMTDNGVKYRIETSSNLASWTDTGSVYTGDGTIFTVTKPIPASPAFWRLVRVQ